MKILFYPDKCIVKSKLWYICEALGLEETNDIDGDFDLAVYYNLKDKSVPDYKIMTVNLAMNVINIGLNNIEKDYVDRMWAKVAGYSIHSHTPPYVRKSVGQWKWDGKIFYDKVPKEEGYVYQKLIDTKLHNGRYRTIRIPVIGKRMPIVILKDGLEQFGGRDNKITWDKQHRKRHISIDEWNVIREFVDECGIDFAELDVLRDKDDLIYIVDINDKPGWPSFKYPEIKETFVESFRKEFL